MRELLAHQNSRARGGLDVIDGKHEYRRLVRAGRAQQIQSRGVAVVDLVAEAAYEVHVRLVAVQRGERNAARPQDARDDLAKAAETGDQDFDFRVFELIEGSLRAALEPGGSRLLRDQQQRPEHHRERHGQDQQVDGVLVEDVLSRGEREQYECELAPARERKSQTPRRLGLQAGEPTQCRHRKQLDRDEPGGEPQKPHRLGKQQPQIGRHADRDEEQTEQQPLERLEIRFELVPELAVGQQHAREERTE